MDRVGKKKIRARFFAKPARIESITFHGQLITYHGPIGCQTPPEKKKGSVNLKFSRSSRLRMLKSVATIDFERAKNSLFVTLTYPDTHFDLPYQVRTRHRYLWWRKLEKFLGREAAGLWRVEWMPRKSGKLIGQEMPHLHMLILDVEFIPWRRVREWWSDVIHADGYVRTDVRKVTGARGAGYYVAKYCGKVPSDCSLVRDLNLNTPGRAYGYQRSTKIPRCEKRVIMRPSKGQVAYLRQLAAAAMERFDVQEGESFCMFSELVAMYEKFLRKIE